MLTAQVQDFVMLMISLFGGQTIFSLSTLCDILGRAQYTFWEYIIKMCSLLCFKRKTKTTKYFFYFRFYGLKTNKQRNSLLILSCHSPKKGTVVFH